MSRRERDIAAIQEELLTRRAAQSLRMFVECAWSILEPTTPFQSNWHIDLICEYLEAVTAGQIRRLVINVPPRYGKSLLVSVLWPVWEWSRHPSTRWIFVSYSESLASLHSLARRRVILSDWYRQGVGRHVRLMKDQQAKREFHNTRRGAMVATSVGGSITGKGGNRIVLDDPHNPTQAESDVQRAHAVDFYHSTLSTRLDDPRRDAIVLVMQRLHTRDLTAVCLEHGFEHVCLPALAETRTTVVFPVSGRTVLRDADSPLWPARETAADLEVQRGMLGSYGFAGQYQQQPVPRAGGMFQREWWGWYDQAPTGGTVIQSWDLAFKDGDGSDYVVGLVARRVGARVYLLDRFKGKVSFVETLRAILAKRTKFSETQMVLIEDAANGPAVINTLQKQVPGIIAVKPEGGKFARAAAVQPQIEAGQVFLPNPRWPDGSVRAEHAWVDDFVETCAMFPKGAHDDDVDALSQLLLRCQSHGGLTAREVLAMNLDRDDDEEEESESHGFGYGGYKPFKG